MKKLSILGLMAGTTLLCAFPVSLQLSQDKLSVSLDTASARVGRPLTATSVAGVARRADRRAYRRGAVAAGVTAGVGVYGARAAYRSGWNDNYWNRPAWGLATAGAAATGLAFGAAAASRANYYGDSSYYGTGMYPAAWNTTNDVRYYPTRTVYSRSSIPMNYIGPICNPRIDLNCQ